MERHRQRQPCPEVTDLFVLLLLALATCRIVRLVQLDQLPYWADLRNQILDRADSNHSTRPLRAAAELLTCPWCLSVWAAAALIGFVLVTPPMLAGGTVCVLAVAQLAGWLSDRRQ